MASSPFLEALIYGVRDVFNGATQLVRKSQLVFRDNLTAQVIGNQIVVDATASPSTPPAVAVSAYEIDWDAGSVFAKTLGAGAQVFTFANESSGMVIIVRVTGAASTLTWPTVKWATGTPPTQTASGTDVYTFVHDGTDIFGSVVQDMS